MAEMYSLQKNIHLGWLLWATRTFLFVDQSSPIFPNVEEVVVDQVFQMFDVSFRFGDIRDRRRKLSEIAPKFRRFLAHPNFRGDFQKLYARYHHCLVARRLEKVLNVRILPLVPKL